MVDLVDAIAQRYGRLPHEVEALDPYALSMAAICVRRANERSTTAIRDHARHAQPVVVVGSLRG